MARALGATAMTPTARVDLCLTTQWRQMLVLAREGHGLGAGGMPPKAMAMARR